MSMILDSILPELHIQNDDNEPCPTLHEIQQWVGTALAETGFDRPAELTLRIVGEREMGELNQRYRGIPRATNVLSFAAELPAHLQLPLLGDIVICAPLLEREARAQNKSSTAHWAHLVIHGTLHLLGYDHTEEAEAEAMERLETLALDKLHFAAAYTQHEQNENHKQNENHEKPRSDKHRGLPREKPASS
jgi:probable rRNA maturation factor